MTAEEFQFDVEEARENMLHSTKIDLVSRQLTVYGYVCINEDNRSSHGGAVVTAPTGALTEELVERAITETIAATVDLNKAAVKAGPTHTCKYVPVALSVPALAIQALTAQLYGVPTKLPDITPADFGADADIIEFRPVEPGDDDESA